jgi:predicted GIY-YIG superfamily endonuclease
MARFQYRVYVIELAKKVYTESAKFRAANPQFNGELECLYVGMTSKDPYVRFEEHRRGYVNKKGHKLSANIVTKYGRYLRGSLFNHIPPMKSRAEALLMEKQLTLELRRQGYAAWSN